MAGLIALIIAVAVFLVVLKAVFLVGAVIIGLGVAVVAYFLAEKLIGQWR